MCCPIKIRFCLVEIFGLGCSLFLYHSGKKAFLLNSSDPMMQALIAQHDLTAASSDHDWINAAESDHPLCIVNFTHFQE